MTYIQHLVRSRHVTNPASFVTGGGMGICWCPEVSSFRKQQDGFLEKEKLLGESAQPLVSPQ